MADDPKKITEEEIKLEQAKLQLLQDQFATQQSIVESLKEVLGVKTKVSESDNTQLKLSREAVRLLSGQDSSLTSIAEKNKDIVKNKKLIDKINVSSDILEKARVKRASILAKSIKEKNREVEEEVAKQLESGKLDQSAIDTLHQEIAVKQKSLKTTLLGLTGQEKIAYLAAQTKENLEEANKEREKERGILENIQKSMGKTGAILAGISKIPILGGLIDSKKVIEELEKSADPLGKKMVGIKKIFTAIGNEAKRSMKDPAVAFGVGSKITKGLFDDIKNVVMMLDEFNGKLTKSFGISQKQAQDLNKEFLETKHTADSEFVTVSGISDAFIALNSKAGTFAEFSKETLNTFAKLNKQAGISTETLTELNDLTYLNQGTLEETTQEFTGQLALLSGQTGKALNLKQLQEDIKDISAAVKLNFGGSATAIAEAVFKAKALGLELKDLESISSSLLNFQSSIEDELSAELLTGKQLNLEGARYAALIGNQGMLAEELANNIGTAADFTNMTVVAQDALAKSLGMNRNQLAETLIQQERLNSLNAKGNTLQERYNNLKAAGNSEEQIATMLGDEQLAQQLESAGMQEKFNVLIENLKEEFLPVAMEILPAIMRTLSYMGKNMGTLINLAIAFKVAQLGVAVASLAVAAAVKGPIAVGLGVAAALAGGFALKAAIGDGILPAGKRGILSPTEGGLIPVSNNDDIVVAPKLAQALAGGGGVRNTQTANSNVTVTPSNINIVLETNGQATGNAKAKVDYNTKPIRALGGSVVDYSASVLG